MRKKVLILIYNQFGYHTDIYMYAKYCDKEKLDLHICCFNTGLSMIEIPGIHVKYITLVPSRLKSYFQFFFQATRYISRNKFDLIIQTDANFTFALRIMNLFQPMVMDIRSGDLSDNNLINWIGNFKISLAAFFYKKVSIISRSLLNQLYINKHKATIVPLGGELDLYRIRQFVEIKLLYIGSLDNRNIEDTIKGFSYFKMGNPDVKIHYDIIGYGSKLIENKINRTISSTGMSSFINFHGRKTIEESYRFFNECNVGIVYVPQKKYYDFQPSTKFFESVLAGMPVIVTNTLENRMALKKGCGIICEDNPISFSNALVELSRNVHKFNSEEIKVAYLEYDWKHIVEHIWAPYIENAIIG